MVSMFAGCIIATTRESVTLAQDLFDEALVDAGDEAAGDAAKDAAGDDAAGDDAVDDEVFGFGEANDMFSPSATATMRNSCMVD